MSRRIRRSVEEPYRTGLSYAEIWNGPDKALIFCWEVGRQLKEKDPEIADRAVNGELVSLPWKGGTGNVDELATGKKQSARYGTLKYLAMWQGLRGDELDIDLDAEITLVCARTKRSVIFDSNTAATLEE